MERCAACSLAGSPLARASGAKGDANPVSQLVQAMAGFGAGSGDGESLNMGPAGLDAPPLLATAQHAFGSRTDRGPPGIFCAPGFLQLGFASPKAAAGKATSWKSIGAADHGPVPLCGAGVRQVTDGNIFLDRWGPAFLLLLEHGFGGWRPWRLEPIRTGRTPARRRPNLNENPGVINEMSAFDLVNMNVLGWDLVPVGRRDPNPPAATTADMVLRRGADGFYEIYDIGNNAILAGYLQPSAQR
jgi:hypothetical protein